ncbi:cation diffusion facilitator family transporter [Brachybacterium sp. AOP25-B2-12]|uniref:cation diffusion facilitator family transporter n=1 Tax=Brachybacterium sp. AOP25-B2-12 TaxID=3457710 RepID=UPI0040338D44
MASSTHHAAAPQDASPTDPAAGESGSGSLRTIMIAFLANILIAVAKTVVAGITGSASMLAEAVHSWADTGNEVLLLIGERRARRPADEDHPLGFGRSGYVWAMFAAIGLFAVGAGVSVWHGIQSLGAPEEGGAAYGWAYLVLALSFVLEGTSFLQSVRQTRAGASGRLRHPIRFIRVTSNPMLRAVFFEDFAALIGIGIATAGLVLHQVTGDPVWDAIGSILVGLLLGVIAINLIRRNSDFLTGEGGTPFLERQILTTLVTDPAVERVSFLHTEWIGPERLFVVAAVDMAGDLPEGTLAVRVQAVEDDLERLPQVGRAMLTLSRPDDPTRLAPEELPEWYVGGTAGD